MAGISSKSAGKLENKKNKFQNQEFDDDLGINYYEFKYRNHDPQICRFIQIDPLANDYVYNSTYAFSENKVTGHIELEGLEAVDIRGLVEKGIRENSTNATDASVDAVMKSYDQGQVKGGIMGATLFKVVAIAALMIFQPEIGFPLAVADITGVPVTPGPQAIVGTVASEARTMTQLEKNIATGADFEKKVGSELGKAGHTSITEQITIKAPNGARTRMDFISRDANGNVVLTEAKGSEVAPLTPGQKLAHPSIEQGGGVVVGKGKSAFPGGTVIQPTKVNVARPTFEIGKPF